MTRRDRMPALQKVVLDASLLVSAAFGGVAAQAFHLALQHRVLVSRPILDELRMLVAQLGKKLTVSQRRLFIRQIGILEQQAEWVEVPGELRLCRDPKDDAYLETCKIGRAHWLLTRDPDLLEIDGELLQRHHLGRLQIVTPAAFLERTTGA